MSVAEPGAPSPESAPGAPSPERARYADLADQLGGMLAGEADAIANLANAAAVIYHGLPQLNWAGFYLLRGDTLVLGPFQGKPACVRIALGRGVCGAAAARRTPMLVADVHAFADHIACDADSRAELVIPLIWCDRLLGVLDLDSPRLNRFGAEDLTGCERLAAVLLRHTGDALDRLARALESG